MKLFKFCKRFYKEKFNINPIQDGLFWDCSRIVGGGGGKKGPPP